MASVTSIMFALFVSGVCVCVCELCISFAEVFPREMLIRLFSVLRHFFFRSVFFGFFGCL